MGRRDRSPTGQRFAATVAMQRDAWLTASARVPEDDPRQGWYAEALGQLDAAVDAHAARQLDRAWRHVHAAQRRVLPALSPHHVDELAAELRHAGEQKLQGWRRRTLVSHLDRADAASSFEERVHYVQAAHRVLYDHYDNMYHRVHLLGRYMALLQGPVLVALAVAVSLAYMGRFPGLNFHTMMAVLAAGALGTAVSISIAAARSWQHKRIPDQVASIQVTVSRTLVGAGAGLLVVLAGLAGYVPIVPGNPAQLLVAAAVGGFSDQFVLRAMNRAAEGGHGDDKPRAADPAASG